MNQNMMEGVLRSAWDAFYFFAIACVLSENQLNTENASLSAYIKSKVMLNLVIEFSHRKF